MSTLQPRPPYSSDELAALYPPQLRLELVQILLRHGERTPITSRFHSAGLPAFWPYCSAVSHLRNAVLDPESGAFSTLEWKSRLESFGHKDSPLIATGPAGELDSVCDMGMLTDRGRETTYELGRRLRRLYIDQLGFLPSYISDADFMYLRSTPVPRALHSLQQTFQGLYPATSRSPDFPPPTIITRAPADETLFPNDTNCRRFAALSRAFAQRAANRWNGTEEMAYLTEKLGKWMPEGSPKVAVDSRPRLSGIMDTINATNAHGSATRLPNEFYDPKVKEIMEKIGVEEWYAGYKESQEYRTLGIGGLLGDIVARMVGSVEHTTPHARFGLSGCHDTTLAATLSSLGAFDDGAWPPFTSHIAIELFSQADQVPSPAAASTKASKSWYSSLFSWTGASSAPGAPAPGIGRKKTPELTTAEQARLAGYYVRVRYNDKPVTVPGCKAPGKHLDGDESFCTLEAFKEIVDKFTPVNWKQQCRVDRKAPAFPDKPQPAGY